MVVSEFSSKTVVRLTGVTARQLDYWATTEFIVPSIQAGHGRGRVRMYSFVDLVQIRVAKQLSDAGISLQKMRKAVTALKALAPDVEKPLAQFAFISDGREVYVAFDEERMVAITQDIGQFYWRLNISDIVRELVDSVEKLAKVETITIIVDAVPYKVVIQQDLDSDWWIGSCPTLAGCVTQGRSREEVREMLADAIKEILAVRGDGISAELA